MNKYIKFGFVLIVVGAITPVVADYVEHRLDKLIDYLEIGTQANLERIAQYKADEAVRALIWAGHYDDYETSAEREQAVKDDYAFFKITSDFYGV